MLEVSEIWPGNEVGEDWTEDWFEVTNTGDTAWVAADHGNLYYDDFFDPAKAALLEGDEDIIASPGSTGTCLDGPVGTSFPGVPEPGTFALLAITGLLGLFGLGRR